MADYALKNILEMLNSGDSFNKTEDDKTFRSHTTEQITNRDEEYTKLLEHFVSITKARNNLKECFKWLFFLVIILSMIALIVITCFLFRKYILSATIEQIMESVPLLITSMVGFISTIITIPTTITKYLFSTKEDEYITKIILHTQKHDMSGRQWAMDFKKFIEKEDKKATNDTKNNEDTEDAS